MIRECNVLPSRGITEERAPETGDSYETEIEEALKTARDQRWVIVMDPGTAKAMVCQNVVTYDGVHIYRPISGRNFLNPEDGIREVLRLRKTQPL